MPVHFIAFLRAIHIVAGSLWVGAATLNAYFLIPSIMAAGPAGGQVMRVMVQVRRMPVFMNTVMLLTLLSGLWLYWWTSSGLNLAWIASSTGLAFTIGGLLAIVTAAFGHFSILATVRRLGALAAAVAPGGPPTPEQAAEMAALQQRLLRGARIGSTLMIVVVIAMAVARYL